MRITKKQAAQFMLKYQNLYPPKNIQGKDSVLEYIKRVGCIQYDPLDMVGSNPNLVLQSSIKCYDPMFLNELLYSDRKLLDGWDKNISIYSVEDWPYFERYRREAAERYGGKSSEIKGILNETREEIMHNGPLSSKDLDFDHKVDWAWAPTRAARAALESMYFWGELIIHHKDGTRKYYDFADKHLPDRILDAKDPNNTLKQYIRWHVKRRIGAIGMLWQRSSHAFLGIHWMKGRERDEAFSALHKKGEILQIDVEDVRYPLYIKKEDEQLLETVFGTDSAEPRASFIAPLDNLLWDRKLIEAIFEFQYKWEVYTPVSERRYGYYVLPVLYDNRFVARIEPRFDKKDRKLYINGWWWEDNAALSHELKRALTEAIKNFAEYLRVCDIVVNCRDNTGMDMGWLKNIAE